MAEQRVVTARTPGGLLVALPVLDLDAGGEGEPEPDDEQLVAAGGVPALGPALAAVEEFSAGFRKAVSAAEPRSATVEFSMAFAVKSGRVVAMFVDGGIEGAVKVTLEWGGETGE